MYGRIFNMTLAACTLAIGVAAMAQNVTAYPSRPIRMIIPFAPGGGVDIAARIVATELSKSWGQSVVVENRSGATGSIGLAQGARAEPDGHTVMAMSSSTLVNQFVSSGVPYDLVRDFAPLTQLVVQPNTLVVHPSVPAKTVKELVAYAKANPGKINYGSSGTGGTSHLSGVLLAQMAGIDITHIPYKGGGQAIVDLLAGSTQMQFGTLLLVGAHVKSGRLRILAVTTTQRSPAAPEVPTVAEAGVPGYEVITWHGMVLPLKTPQPIVAKLNNEIARIMRSPEIAPRLAADGSQAATGTPAEFAALLKSETIKWSKVVKDFGVKAE